MDIALASGKTMVLCLIALPIFALLSIFSVKYRRLTADALECLLKTATFRKCKSGLDNKIKAGLTGKVLKVSPRVAGFFYRHYKIISWIVLVLFLWSMVVSVIGINNYVRYGNCNGPSSDGFCVFDPTGRYSGTSGIDVTTTGEFLAPVLENDDPIRGQEKAEPVVQEVLDYYEGRVNLQFKSFILPSHLTSYPAALASDCALEQEKYEGYHQMLFARQGNITADDFGAMARELGMDGEQFDACFTSEKYKSEVEGDTIMGLKAQVGGTPTFFINGQMIVGPKPFKTFKTIIDAELEG